MNPRDVHSESLATSTALSGYYVKNFIAPLQVVRVLDQAGVPSMLLGAHGLGGWMQKPRATEHVDVFIALRNHKKAVRALLAAFPYLLTESQPAVTRLRDPQSGKVVIDVMKPDQELYRDALRHTHTVQAGDQNLKIPSLEMALAMKFAAIISRSWANADKYLDVHDFGHMILANAHIDLEKLSYLGDRVCPGGGAEVIERVHQVRAGEKLNL